MSSDHLQSGTSTGLYKIAVRDVMENGEWVQPLLNKTSPSASHKTIELLGLRMDLEYPRSRIISSLARPINLGFAFGNFMYQFMETDSVEPLLYYNPITTKFSDDGVSLHGAYGPRIIRQLESVIAMLKADPASRRAVVTIFSGAVDHIDSKDIPCPISMQFFVRHRRLHCITTFRSQNIVMVYPYDIFLFTMLHEWVAVHVGLDVGMHIQNTGSMHFYENEMNLANEILDQESYGYTMPRMSKPESGEWSAIMHYERNVRLWGDQLMPAPDFPMVDPYWQGILSLLTHFAKIKRRGEHVMRDATILDDCFTEA